MPHKNFLTEKNRLNAAVLPLGTKNHRANISGKNNQKWMLAARFCAIISARKCIFSYARRHFSDLSRFFTHRIRNGGGGRRFWADHARDAVLAEPPRQH